MMRASESKCKKYYYIPQFSIEEQEVIFLTIFEERENQMINVNLHTHTFPQFKVYESM